MPILNLKISGQKDKAIAQKAVIGLTDLTEKYLKKKPEVTAVTVTFIPKEFWFINKQSIESLDQNSFYLDIKITDSTNLKDEKADYIKNVFNFMSCILDKIHPESYIYIEEVKADAYGFSGLTQEYRYIQSKQ